MGEGSGSYAAVDWQRDALAVDQLDPDLLRLYRRKIEVGDRAHLAEVRETAVGRNIRAGKATHAELWRLHRG